MDVFQAGPAVGQIPGPHKKSLYGFNFVEFKVLFLKNALGPLPGKVKQLHLYPGGVETAGGDRQEFQSALKSDREVDLKAFFKREPGYALGLAPQGVRVFASRGDHFQSEVGGKGVQLAGQGHKHPLRRRRQGGLGRKRPVKFAHGAGSGFAEARVFRVVITHCALQFRKFPDYIAHKIRVNAARSL